MGEVLQAVADERRAQIAFYESLSSEDWERPSLCDGWRVRHVLAHTTMPFRWSTPGVLLGVVRARGSFDRFADRAARGDADTLTPDRMLGCLRANVEHPWSPPGGGPLGALSHDVIHGLDTALALGRDEHVSPDRVATVLNGMRPVHLRGFGTSLHEIRLEATDVELTRGDGDLVRGRAADLLAAVCGRAVPDDRITGRGAATLRAAGHPERTHHG